MTPCKFKNLNGKEGTVANWDAEVLAEWKIVGANSCVSAHQKITSNLAIKYIPHAVHN